MQKVLKAELPQVTSRSNTDALIDLNLKIIAEWKKKIFEWINNIDVTSMSELRSLSLAIDDAFKQNQLLNGGATENNKIEIVISKD